MYELYTDEFNENVKMKLSDDETLPERFINLKNLNIQ